MNRLKQIQKAWKQNDKIRQVPDWRTWMNHNPSAQNYESCMEERDSIVEEIKDWNMRINQRDRGHYCY